MVKASPLRIGSLIIAAALLPAVFGCQNINVDTEIVSPPTILPVSGAYGAEQTVTIDHVDPDVVIYYTVGDAASPPPAPTTSSAEYTAPFPADFGTTIVRAIATKPGLRDSLVASRTIRVVWNKVSTGIPVAGFDEFPTRVQAAAGLDDASIVVYGVYNSGHLYRRFEVGTGTWSDPADDPGTERDGASLVRLGAQLFLIGGFDYVSGVDTLVTTVQSLSGTTWSEAGSVSGRYLMGAAPAGSSLYVAGGRTSADELTGAEQYSDQTGTEAWDAIDDLPAKRYYFSMAYVEDHLYAFGGIDDSGITKLSSILDYSEQSGLWNLHAASLPREVAGTSAVPWYDSSEDKTYVLVFGNHVEEGNASAGDTQVGEVVFFDPELGTIALGTTLEGDDARMSAAVNLGGRIFLVCSSGNIWEYDPALDY